MNEHRENNENSDDQLDSRPTGTIREALGSALREQLTIRNYDAVWKTFSDFHVKEMARYFVKKEDYEKLDLDNISQENPERQTLVRQKLGIPKGASFLDKLYRIPFTSGPFRYLLLHFEFQTRAGASFTRRMVGYKLHREVDSENMVLSYAIIVEKDGTYQNSYQLDRQYNGVLVIFEDHVIESQKESHYQRPDCIVSLALYSVWLYVKRSHFSDKELLEKYSEIMKRVVALESAERDYVSQLFLIAKYALASLKDQNLFDIFAERINKLKPMNRSMNFIEQAIEEGREKGIEEGLEKGRVEGRVEGREEGAKEVLIRLFQTGKHTLQELAAATDISVYKLKEMLASGDR